MSLGDIEKGLSHDHHLGFCPFCKDRGVNNWTEITNRGVCGSCKQFLLGELDHDIPELKLYLKNMGKETASRPVKPTPQPQQPAYEPKVSPPSSEIADFAEWLASNPDRKLRHEILSCITSDKDALYQILSDSRYFSLKELKKHAERLKRPVQEAPLSTEQYEQVILNRKLRRPKVEKPDEKRKKKRVISRNYMRRRKERKQCLSPQNLFSRETTKTSPLNTEKEPQKSEAQTNQSSPILKEKVNVPATQSQEKAHLNVKNFGTNQEE